jgi:hypothetical protein
VAGERADCVPDVQQLYARCFYLSSNGRKLSDFCLAHIFVANRWPLLRNMREQAMRIWKVGMLLKPSPCQISLRHNIMLSIRRALDEFVRPVSAF